MKTRPLGDRILIRPDDAEEKAGNIFIPETLQQQPAVGEIVAMGPGRYEDGAYVPVEVKIGDRVLFGRYAGKQIEDDGRVYILLGYDDILGIETAKEIVKRYGEISDNSRDKL